MSTIESWEAIVKDLAESLIPDFFLAGLKKTNELLAVREAVESSLKESVEKYVSVVSDTLDGIEVRQAIPTTAADLVTIILTDALRGTDPIRWTRLVREAVASGGLVEIWTEHLKNRWDVCRSAFHEAGIEVDIGRIAHDFARLLEARLRQLSARDLFHQLFMALLVDVSHRVETLQAASDPEKPSGASWPPSFHWERPKDTEVLMHPVWTGQALVSALAPVLSYDFQNVEPNTQAEAELIAAFFQELNGFDEVDIIGPAERVRFEFEMTDWLRSLAEEGFYVLVGQYDQWLCVETRRERFPVGVVCVERAEKCLETREGSPGA